MHWHLIRLIGRRELSDLFRDRRTVFMIFILPVALYPLLGFVALQFAIGSVEQVSVVGIAGLEHLPPATAHSGPFSPLPAMTWLSATPALPSGAHVAGIAALTATVRARLDYPPLVIAGTFPDLYCDFPTEPRSFRVQPLPDASRTPLDARAVDLLLVVPSDLLASLDANGRANLDVYYREGDERSRLADRRLKGVLNRWEDQLKAVRFLRRGLPANFDQPIQVTRPQQSAEPFKQLTEELSGMIARFFPFLLIMWALAGALHPAIDLTAGEKERATLETLLLTPASRGEIVLGKFLAVWFFSALTALWNLLWLGGAAWLASLVLPFVILRFMGLFWCGVLTVMLAALFSAVSMALGAYARSSKEGQYYLLPIFIITMPLTFLPLLPGVELNLAYSITPVTGPTLLLQKLMQPTIDADVWVYFVPVLGSLIVCNVLALRWAVSQFRREEVLFRDAQGMDMLGRFWRRLRPRRPS